MKIHTSNLMDIGLYHICLPNLDV